MTQKLRPGSRWASIIDDTEVIVVKVGSGDPTLECGGHPMVPVGTEKSAGLSVDSRFSSGTELGKRYEHATGLELLCTKAGQASLGVIGEPLSLKGSKPLPASD
jgi:hypothetical protein